jgi:hypothetical protein
MEGYRLALVEYRRPIPDGPLSGLAKGESPRGREPDWA